MDEFESWNTSMDIPGAREFIVCNRQPSMTQVLRDVKRREHELLNCLCSILYDSKFVQRVVNGFEVLPLLGNLRCGAWYAEKPKATCYFKSTDGHTGQWSFSLTRLNLHVADIAVEYGGVCIVDATRRGKRFPDSLSKTIPIWAAVINTAVSMFQQDHHMLHIGTEDEEFLWLPSWIPDHEWSQIERKIDFWACQLLDSGLGLSTVAASLHKPLRCFWISQDDDCISSCVEHVQAYAADYIPIILISASHSGVRERKRLQMEIQGGRTVDCVFDYIPGAGDDEESWAKGLTPEIMWNNCWNLFTSGPEDIEQCARQLLQENRSTKQTTANSCMDTASRADLVWLSDSGIGLASMSWLLHKDNIDRYILGDTALVVPSCTGGMPPACSSYMAGHEIADFVVGAGMVNKQDKTLKLRRPLDDSARILRLPECTPRKNCVVSLSPLVLEFASVHLWHRGGRVIFAFDNAESASYAAAFAVATLICCFLIDDKKSEISWKKVKEYRLDRDQKRIVPSLDDLFSRQMFRKYVANSIAKSTPWIILRQSLLKQIFNIFMSTLNMASSSS